MEVCGGARLPWRSHTLLACSVELASVPATGYPCCFALGVAAAAAGVVAGAAGD